MPLTRVVRSRGANIVVTAYGELLFTPTGDIARWNRSLSNKVRGAAQRGAPVNKRPRWAHYGKPLKSTMRSSTGIDTARMRVHAAVGSTSPYGYYVDQGTGVYAGRGPYPAKILPPRSQGGSDLYEHTWRPGGGAKRVNPVLIKGQKGQEFLDAGLQAGFRAMRMPTAVVPGGGSALVSAALDSFPEGLENFFGNTPVSSAFVAQLTEWRAWRDDAWKSAREAKSQAAAQRYTDKRKAAQAAQDRILADIAGSEKAANLANYQASKDAAKRRALAQAAKLKAQRDRDAEAKRIREEKAAETRAADQLRRGNERTRREALDFYAKIRQTYPNAQWATPVQLGDGVILYRVVYTLSSGEVVRQRWAYGYAT